MTNRGAGGCSVFRFLLSVCVTPTCIDLEKEVKKGMSKEQETAVAVRHRHIPRPSQRAERGRYREECLWSVGHCGGMHVPYYLLWQRRVLIKVVTFSSHCWDSSVIV
jgi:hypothetical protein